MRSTKKGGRLVKKFFLLRLAKSCLGGKKRKTKLAGRFRTKYFLFSFLSRVGTTTFGNGTWVWRACIIIFFAFGGFGGRQGWLLANEEEKGENWPSCKKRILRKQDARENHFEIRTLLLILLIAWERFHFLLLWKTIILWIEGAARGGIREKEKACWLVCGRIVWFD